METQKGENVSLAGVMKNVENYVNCPNSVVFFGRFCYIDSNYYRVIVGFCACIFRFQEILSGPEGTHPYFLKCSFGSIQK